MRPCTYLITYLLTYIYAVGPAYKNINVFETVEYRAKVTINGLYKIVHGLSIAAIMYDIEWPLSEIQGHRFLKCGKNNEIQISNDSDAM